MEFICVRSATRKALPTFGVWNSVVSVCRRLFIAMGSIEASVNDLDISATKDAALAVSCGENDGSLVAALSAISSWAETGGSKSTR